MKIESNGLSMPEFFLAFATQFLKSLMNLNNQTEKLMLISIKICKKIVLSHACVLVPSFTPFVKSVGKKYVENVVQFREIFVEWIKNSRIY